MNKMLLKCLFTFIVIFVFASCLNSTYAQIGIEFSFANPTLTNELDDHFLEFDILAQATANSQFKIAQFYLNFNTAGFGTSLVNNGNVSITKGELLNDTFINEPPNFGYGSYSATVVDNNPTILAIQNLNIYVPVPPSGYYRGYELSNTLGTTPKVYVHVKMKIFDQTERSGISFNTTINQWDIQNYYYTTPFTDDQTIYVPAIETSELDVPLEGIVPVELISFNAKIRNTDVLLNWNTATEVNNFGFEIERKLMKEEFSNNTFQKIGFIPGSGNSNSPKEYSFIDKKIEPGKYLYRLKQIDNDGVFEYSPEVLVSVEVPLDYMLQQNFPNPFNPSTKITFSIPEAGLVKLTVYNLLGQQIQSLVEEQRQPGTYTELFNASELNSGVYFYELRVNNFIITKKMQLLK